MGTIAFLSFLTLFLYLGFMFLKHGITKSISDGYYVSKNKWLFSAVMLLTAGLLLPTMLEFGDVQFLAFFAVAALMFVAAEPHFKSDWGGKIHNTAAIIAGICSQLWCFINCWQSSLIVWLFLALVFTFGYKYVKQKGKPLKALKIGYWTEVAAFINVYLTIIIL